MLTREMAKRVVRGRQRRYMEGGYDTLSILALVCLLSTKRAPCGWCLLVSEIWTVLDYRGLLKRRPSARRRGGPHAAYKKPCAGMGSHNGYALSRASGGRVYRFFALPRSGSKVAQCYRVQHFECHVVLRGSGRAW